MEWASARRFLSSVCSRDPDAGALSRRDMLAGFGLAGLLVAAPTLLTSSPAEAGTADAPAAPPERPADAVNAAEAGVVESDADAPEFSAQRWRRRYWRRRYWRRRHWRRVYWRRRYWRGPYWRRRRYWRRRYWRRRYWRPYW